MKLFHAFRINLVLFGFLFATLSAISASVGADLDWVQTAPLWTPRADALLEACDGSIYVGTQPNGDVFRSTNGGATWEPTGNLSEAWRVTSLLQESCGYIYAGTDVGIFRTNDNGRTWVNTGGPRMAYTLIEASDAYVYAGNSRVFRTNDHGANWDRRPFPPELDYAEDVYSLLEASDGYIYAGIYPEGDVFKTNDGGTTWNNTGNLGAALGVFSLLEASDGYIYAGTYSEGAVYRTNDGGAVWTRIGIGLGHWSLLEGSDGYIYAGTFRTNDGGKTWSDQGPWLGAIPYDLIEASNHHLYGTFGGEVWKTTARIPEPSTLALLLTGFIAPIAYALRRRQARGQFDAQRLNPLRDDAKWRQH